VYSKGVKGFLWVSHGCITGVIIIFLGFDRKILKKCITNRVLRVCKERLKGVSRVSQER
jgi:hypothetical protein